MLDPDPWQWQVMESIRDDLCSKDSLNELLPKVITMKRMIMKRITNPKVKTFLQGTGISEIVPRILATG
jgi:hypothetical protein